MEELIQKLKDNNLIDNVGNIILEIYEEGYQAVDKETFKNFFNVTDYSYEQLVAEDKGKGYTRFFDKWKELGVI
jgi:hypothetical protein